MLNLLSSVKRPLSGAVLLISLGLAQPSLACGGFFVSLYRLTKQVSKSSSAKKVAKPPR